MKILIAEDDSTSALVLRKALEKMGHEVVVAEDGEIAWQVIAHDDAFEHRLIISDWMMPEVDGLEFARRLRATRTPHEPYRYLILLTARGRAEDRRMGLEAGADDFMTKPLDIGDLVARLEVAQRILALQQDVEARGNMVARLQGQLEQAAPLGEVLISQGVITPSQLRQALDQQSEKPRKLGAILIENGWVDEEDITRARSVQVDLPYIAVSEETPDPLLLALVPEEIARKHGILPLSVREDATGGEAVRVAVLNPWNIEGLDQVRALTKRRVEPLLASEGALAASIDRAYRGVGTNLGDEFVDATGEAGEAAGGDLRDASVEDFDTTSADANAVDQAPVIRLINTVLTDAIRRRASDIHIEPYRKDFEIRYRIDGELHVIRSLPRQFLAATASRLKIMAELDIAERRLPQDGRISLRVDGRGVDLRISTLPNQYGERVVLRVLDRAATNMSLDQLAFSQTNQRYWETLIHRPYGIILVTGPTGSGKTTTLYATLNALKSPAVNIMTCEDPIEYELDRISQSNVNEKAGLTFARQLRAILRQDPDVVLVGEIRDTETAETAFRAALTGHLVLSTLHCNEAPGAPTRLADMGVPAFLISSAIIGVTAQRLVRRLCPDCREPYEPDARQRDLLYAMNEGRPLTVPTLYRAKGCPKCDNLGYRGRMGVHEILMFDDRLQALVMQGADTKTLRSAAVESGMIPMIEDGLAKAAQGLTSLEELQKRVGGGFALQ
jgi:Type II secretory pathway, ATPase PulE/Tfp pilus assembly pathway, ATPase PilB